jgi:Ca2+-binding RTX toxin-like protein
MRNPVRMFRDAISSSARRPFHKHQTRLWLELLETRYAPALSPLSDPFTVVDPTLSGSNWNANVAMDGSGNFTVVWENDTLDGDHSGIFARRFNNLAQPLGDYFQVNSTASGYQILPSVAMHADGTSVVAWSENGYGSVVAQLFEQDGSAFGGNFPIVDTADAYGLTTSPSPQVFMYHDGEFAVLYKKGDEFRVQSFDVDWNPGNDRAVYSFTSGSTYHSFVGRRSKMDADGTLYLPVERYEAQDGTSTYTAIVRRIDTAGNAIEVTLVSATQSGMIPFTNYQLNVTPLQDGGFYVTYLAGPGDAQAAGTLLGQRYGADGTAVGSRVVLVGADRRPDSGGTLATLSDGDIIVAWAVDIPNANDESYFQVFSPDGVSRGPARLVANNLESQAVFGIAPDSERGFALVWFDQGDDGEVYVQRWIDAPLTVTQLGPVSPNPRDTPLDSIDVTFSTPIDISTFDFHDISLNRGAQSIALSNLVTITHVAGGTYRIGNLGSLTGLSGVYTLSVFGFAIQSTTGDSVTGSKTIQWTKNEPVPPPQISQFGPVSSTRAFPLDTIDVTFTAPINAATLTYQDFALTRSGGANLLTSAVTVTQISSTVYRLGNLTGLTTRNGSYNLTVSAVGVRNTANQAGSGSRSVTWTMDEPAARIQSVGPVSPNPRASGLPSLQVVFSREIEATTFTLADLKLTRGTTVVPLPSSVTISRIGIGVYVINNLASLTEKPGEYHLTVTGAGILNRGGAATANNATKTWTRQGVYAWLDNTVLRIVGSPADDSIAVRQVAGKISVEDRQILAGGVLVNDLAVTRITKIEVTGDAGADDIRFRSSSISGFQDITLPTVISGGAGNDLIRGVAGVDTIDGGNDSDDIDGMKGNDIINGGAGNDLLRGGLGDDKIHGNAGSDTLYGDENNDSLYGDAGDDFLYGIAGDDFLYGGADNDYLDGGDDDDVLYGEAGVDKLYGFDGHDNLVGGTGNDFLYGGKGEDGLGGDDPLVADQGDDYLEGGDDNDTLVGGNGNDKLVGGKGNDTLRGGKGNDKLYGQTDHDKLYGGDGDDYLDGAGGNDTLYGDADSDTLLGSYGDDILYGVLGEDTLIGGLHDDTLVVSLSFDTLLAKKLRTPIDPAPYAAKQAGDDTFRIILDLGAFGRSVLAPILAQAKQFSHKVKPLADLLTTKVPVVSNYNPLKGYTYLDLIKNFIGKNDYANLTTFIGIVRTLENSDIPTLTSFIELGAIKVSSVDEIFPTVPKINLPVINELRTKLKKAGVELPIFNDTAFVVRAILGQNVELVTYTLPALNLKLNKTFATFPVAGIPKVASVNVKVKGDFSFSAGGTIGYDMLGIQSGDPKDGIFVRGLYAKVGVGIALEGGVDVIGIVSGGVGGRIGATVSITIGSGGKTVHYDQFIDSLRNLNPDLGLNFQMYLYWKFPLAKKQTKIVYLYPDD